MCCNAFELVSSVFPNNLERSLTQLSKTLSFFEVHQNMKTHWFWQFDAWWGLSISLGMVTVDATATSTAAYHTTDNKITMTTTRHTQALLPLLATATTVKQYLFDDVFMISEGGTMRQRPWDSTPWHGMLHAVVMYVAWHAMACHGIRRLMTSPGDDRNSRGRVRNSTSNKHHFPWRIQSSWSEGLTPSPSCQKQA